MLHVQVASVLIALAVWPQLALGFTSAPGGSHGSIKSGLNVKPAFATKTSLFASTLTKSSSALTTSADFPAVRAPRGGSNLEPFLNNVPPGYPGPANREQASFASRVETPYERAMAEFMLSGIDGRRVAGPRNLTPIKNTAALVASSTANSATSTSALATSTARPSGGAPVAGSNLEPFLNNVPPGSHQPKPAEFSFASSVESPYARAMTEFVSSRIDGTRVQSLAS